jgi:hypothetical protein
VKASVIVIRRMPSLLLLGHAHKDPGFESRFRLPATLVDVFHGFPQSLQLNASLVP